MITLSNVHKAFGSNKVLQGITLEVPRGTSCVIIGGSLHVNSQVPHYHGRNDALLNLA